MIKQVQPINQFDQMPPYDVDAERCVLASIMLCGSAEAMFAEVRSILADDDFFQADHSIIFRCVLHMADRKVPVDSITLCGRAEKSGSP